MLNLRKRFNGTVAEMRAVFESFDDNKSGLLPMKDCHAGCAALGVVLSAAERDFVNKVALAKDGSNNVLYNDFCDYFRD